jgi:r-opsin
MENITMNAGRNVSLALARKHDFNPWSVPDDYTVYNFAPDYVKPLLHPHWQTQKAVHPIYAYFFGMYYLVMGKKYTGFITFKLKH